MTTDHPMEKFRSRRSDWTQNDAAKHFRLRPGYYRQLVNGWRGVSTSRATDLAKRSQGEFSAWDVLAWHEVHKRQPPEQAKKGRAAPGGDAADPRPAA